MRARNASAVPSSLSGPGRLRYRRPCPPPIANIANQRDAAPVMILLLPAAGLLLVQAWGKCQIANPSRAHACCPPLPVRPLCLRYGGGKANAKAKRPCARGPGGGGQEAAAASPAPAPGEHPAGGEAACAPPEPRPPREREGPALGLSLPLAAASAVQVRGRAPPGPRPRPPRWLALTDPAAIVVATTLAEVGAMHEQAAARPARPRPRPRPRQAGGSPKP